MSSESRVVPIFVTGVLLGVIIGATAQMTLFKDAGSFSAENGAPSGDREGKGAIRNEVNRVSNGGFESGLEGWHSRRSLEAFRVSGENSGKTSVLAVESTPPKEIKERVIYEAKLGQCVPLEDGRRYRFSAQFNAQSIAKSEHANRVNLSWYQSTDCSTRGQFATYLEPDGDKEGWQTVSRNNVLRALGARSAKIAVTQNRRPGNTGLVYWDDISLVPTESVKLGKSAGVGTSGPIPPPGTNYLENGAFKEGLNGWAHTGDTEWTGSTGFQAPGAARLAIVSDDGGYGAYSFSQCVNLGKDRVFKASARVKVDPSSTEKGGGIFRLSWYEFYGCRGRSRAGFVEDRIENVKGWQDLTIESTQAPEDASSVNVYFTRGIEDTGAFAYFIDDVFFRSIKED